MLVTIFGCHFCVTCLHYSWKITHRYLNYVINIQIVTNIKIVTRLENIQIIFVFLISKCQFYPKWLIIFTWPSLELEACFILILIYSSIAFPTRLGFSYFANLWILEILFTNQSQTRSIRWLIYMTNVIWYSFVVVYQTGVNWCPLWWVIIGFLWVIIIFLVCNIENWKTTTSRVSRHPIGQYSGAWSEVSHQMIHNDIISMSHSF